MNSFISYGLRKAYDRLAKLGDPLAGVNVQLWERFRSIAEELMALSRTSDRERQNQRHMARTSETARC